MANEKAPRKKKTSSAGGSRESPYNVSGRDRLRLALEANRSVKAVENVLRGCAKPIVRDAVKAAAEKLGIEIGEV